MTTPVPIGPIDLTGDDFEPGTDVTCTNCEEHFIVPAEGLTERYPCGDSVENSPECEHCVAMHVEYCNGCWRAIQDAWD